MNDEYILNRFSERGFPIDIATARRFAVYCDMLREWSGRMNLTAVRDEKEITDRHFLDSLLPLSFGIIKKGARCADVGTGAGFPGVPLAILRPDISMTLIDSLSKRLVFLNAVIEALDIQNCITLHARAEDAAKTALRESFDVVFSRAVTKTAALTELCLPLTRVGGVMAALKSVTAAEELMQAQYASGLLGGDEGRLLGTEERNIIVIKKIAKTPALYPRKAGTPEKAPLMKN